MGSSSSGGPPKKRRAREIEENELLRQAGQTLASIRDRAAHTQQKGDDEFDKFGSFVAAELRQIKNKKDLKNCKKVICNALFDSQCDDSS